jgi:hypothetical protein
MVTTVNNFIDAPLIANELHAKEVLKFAAYLQLCNAGRSE